MKTLISILILSAFIILACSKDKEKVVNYPKELIAVTAPTDFKAFVGGVEISTDGLQPEKFFTTSSLSKDKYYISFLSDTTLDYVLTTDPAYRCGYFFKEDSLFIYSIEAPEDGNYFEGKGNKTQLSMECAACKSYLYKKKNGQIVDINADGIVNIQDKLRVNGVYNQYSTVQDVLNKFGYSSLSEMETKDTIIIYNYKFFYKSDKNGDRMITSADN